MSYYKKKLIVLLVVGVGVVVLYNVIDAFNYFASGPEDFPPFGWHWWVAMSYWLYVGGWVLLLKCPHCKAPQIYRGVHFSQWHWPSDSCWNCGYELRKVNGT